MALTFKGTLCGRFWTTLNGVRVTAFGSVWSTLITRMHLQGIQKSPPYGSRTFSIKETSKTLLQRDVLLKCIGGRFATGWSWSGSGSSRAMFE
ncbi:hypothetical protein LguiA_019152 [Lonicera macranthoides]